MIRMIDFLIQTTDKALRTVHAKPQSARPSPAQGEAAPADLGFSAAQKREIAALMRVNHVGEVCAQALYNGQALATRDHRLRAQLQAAAQEETDHLAWTLERLEQLGDRPSLLNPLWYAGAFAIGYGAARMGGDKVSLGFVIETEKQVGAHLQSHLDRLPENDLASRAIVTQMKNDEMAHADAALESGGIDLPTPVKGLMRLAAKVMTTVAHRV
jgi:3-demethoxyubiquinol 3-hydroxylase